MFITSLSTVPPFSAGSHANTLQEPAPSARSSESSVTRRIDFSHVSPRQLLTYVDEMIKADRIDPMDATSLMCSLGAGQFEEAPDAPFDLRSSLKGTVAFHREKGDVDLAQWYVGLLGRLDIMEGQSVCISTTA